MFKVATSVDHRSSLSDMPIIDRALQTAFVAPISVQALSERLAVLAEIELPCVFYTPESQALKPCQGVIRRMERGEGQLEIKGDDFALSLRHNDSIWLVNRSNLAHGGLAVEIYNRAGSMITRIFSQQDGVNSQVWRDVMDNPLLLAA